MLTRNTTTKAPAVKRTPEDPFGHNPPARGKHVAYDRYTKDHYAYFDGRFIGARTTRREAEELLDDHAYDLARHEGFMAGYKAGLQDARA